MVISEFTSVNKAVKTVLREQMHPRSLQLLFHLVDGVEQKAKDSGNVGAELLLSSKHEVLMFIGKTFPSDPQILDMNL